MPETHPTRSSFSCLLVVGIQLSTATCCSGVYTLCLISKWEKEIACACEPSGTHAPRTVTSVPNGMDFFDEPFHPVQQHQQPNTTTTFISCSMMIMWICSTFLCSLVLSLKTLTWSANLCCNAVPSVGRPRCPLSTEHCSITSSAGEEPDHWSLCVVSKHRKNTLHVEGYTSEWHHSWGGLMVLLCGTLCVC